MGEPHAPVEQVAQRAPAEILEDEVGPVGVVAPVEDPQHVGVVERGHRTRLGPEALEERLVGGKAGLQHLDRDMALQRHVLGEVDVGGGAGAQCGEQPVPLPKDPADGVRYQGHRAGPTLPSTAGIAGGRLLTCTVSSPR